MRSLLQYKRDKKFFILISVFSTIILVEILSSSYIEGNSENKSSKKNVRYLTDKLKLDYTVINVPDRYNKAILVSKNNVLPRNQALLNKNRDLEQNEVIHVRNENFHAKERDSENRIVEDSKEKMIVRENPLTEKYSVKKNKTSKIRSKPDIVPLKRKDIRKNGPSFKSLHDWSLYLNTEIYKHGLPRQFGAINFINEEGKKEVWVGYRYEPPDISVWNKNKTLWDRKGRFPSVEERIKYYLGKWYDNEVDDGLFFNTSTSCTNNSNDLFTTEFYHSILVNPFDFNPKTLYDFAFYNPKDGKKSKEFFMRRNAQYYTRDIIDMAVIHTTNKYKAPLLLHFGDGPSKGNQCFNISYPVFSKVRDLVAESSSDHCRFYGKNGDCKRPIHSNIIWPLNRGRHFRPTGSVPFNDIPWNKKKPKLVWRGRALCEEARALDTQHSAEVFSCEQRMALVRNHVDSKIIDAKFHVQPKSLGEDAIPDAYFGKKMEMKQMLRHKYLLAVEGTDVSSGLKWMLFSKSVVLMPTPTFVSWAMESLLVPFVHYIPIKADMSNVEEMVLWAEENPEKASHIAQMSTLFMYDLFFHPQAYQDEEDILAGILKVYEKKFRPRTG